MAQIETRDEFVLTLTKQELAVLYHSIDPEHPSMCDNPLATPVAERLESVLRGALGDEDPESLLP